ncbi:MAG: AMP-binding protein [Planctomycetota bacterium]
MNPASFLDRAARTFGDRIAVSGAGGSSTYGELQERVARWTGYLKARGVEHGDRVALLLPNVPSMLEASFAVARIGAVSMPCNSRLRAEDLAAPLAHGRPKVGVADVSLAELARSATAHAEIEVDWTVMAGDGLPREVARAVPHTETARLRAEDALNLYYTSGTTGTPKGVVLTAQNVTTHALIAAAELGLCDGDAWLHAAPMFHLADAWAMWAITAVGGRHVFAGPSFDAGSFWRTVPEEGVTLTNLVPTMLIRALQDPAASSGRAVSMRKILSGGAPMAPSLVEKIEAIFGCPYVQTYGLTETSPYLTLSLEPPELLSHPDEVRRAFRARTGRPVIGVELRLVDEDGRDVPKDDRSVGEILVQGPTVTPGYYRAPELTEQAFDDGWLRTGDLATWDRYGSVNIVDRKKDVILSGGENVYSAEVEGVLQAHPAISELVVVGAPDDEYGEVVCAVVVLRPGAELEPSTLMEWSRTRLSGFKRPRRVEIVTELPRTGSGKLDKKTVRARFWRGRQRKV